MDDLISRQAAIETVKKHYRGIDNDLLEVIAYEMEELPSAQPVVISKLENATECEDAVSRFEVLRLIDYSSNDLNDSVDNWYFQGKVKELPSVTPKQPGWIPCTPETMPKNKSNVLTVIYIPGRQAHIRSGWYEDGLFMNDNGDTWKATDKEVVGWMYQPKLPNPREGGQDGKN